MTYEYACGACGHEWEAEQSIREDPLKKCPKCGKLQAKRQISRGAGFILKGGGWYADGYGSSKGSSSGSDSGSPDKATGSSNTESKGTSGDSKGGSDSKKGDADSKSGSSDSKASPSDSKKPTKGKTAAA